MEHFLLVLFLLRRSVQKMDPKSRNQQNIREQNKQHISNQPIGGTSEHLGRSHLVTETQTGSTQARCGRLELLTLMYDVHLH